MSFICFSRRLVDKVMVGDRNGSISTKNGYAAVCACCGCGGGMQGSNMLIVAEVGAPLTTAEIGA